MESNIRRNVDERVEVLMHSPLAGDFWHVCTPEEEGKIKVTVEAHKNELEAEKSRLAVLDEEIAEKQSERVELNEKINSMESIARKYDTIFPTPVEEIVEEVVAEEGPHSEEMNLN